MFAAIARSKESACLKSYLERQTAVIDLVAKEDNASGNTSAVWRKKMPWAWAVPFCHASNQTIPMGSGDGCPGQSLYVVLWSDAAERRQKGGRWGARARSGRYPPPHPPC